MNPPYINQAPIKMSIEQFQKKDIMHFDCMKAVVRKGICSNMLPDFNSLMFILFVYRTDKFPEICESAASAQKMHYQVLNKLSAY